MHCSCLHGCLHYTCRVFRLNGKLATRTAVRQELLKQHVFGELSFVRQAQVAQLVQNSSAAMLAGITSGEAVLTLRMSDQCAQTHSVETGVIVHIQQSNAPSTISC